MSEQGTLNAYNLVESRELNFRSKRELRRVEIEYIYNNIHLGTQEGRSGIISVNGYDISAIRRSQGLRLVKDSTRRFWNPRFKEVEYVTVLLKSLNTQESYMAYIVTAENNLLGVNTVHHI